MDLCCQIGGKICKLEKNDKEVTEVCVRRVCVCVCVFQGEKKRQRQIAIRTNKECQTGKNIGPQRHTGE